jgi:metal-responsive CopG/Arc/MetJ family transcriptional regulator
MNETMPPKKRVTVSLSKDILEWVDAQVEDRTYKDRSHAIEKIIYDRMQEAEKKP